MKNVLSKNPEERTLVEIDQLATILNDLKYFKDMIVEEEERLEFIKESSKYLQYKMYPKGTELFKKGKPFSTFVGLSVIGDKGQNFYIIMKGEAYVYVPKKEDELDKDCIDEAKKEAYNDYITFIKDITPTLVKQSSNPPSKASVKGDLTKLVLSQSNGISLKSDLSNEEKLLLLNDNQREKTPYFIKGTATYKKVAGLRDGDHFGELALIFNQPRFASVIANQDLHLLCVKGQEYIKVFHGEVQSILEKINFFEKSFSTVSKNEIKRFCLLIREKSYKFKDIIHKEGEACEGVYFIRQGEVQVIISIISFVLNY